MGAGALYSKECGALTYLIVGGSLLGYTGYVYLLTHVPVAKAATYAYVNPLVAVLLGALCWARGWKWAEYGGMALVVLAVFLITTAKIGGGNIKVVEDLEGLPAE